MAEQGAVEPGDLVKAGRMQSQSLLIITPLDNPDHVDIVKQLCRYLKEWCGVGTTYFAFDESTGNSHHHLNLCLMQTCCCRYRSEAE